MIWQKEGTADSAGVEGRTVFDASVTKMRLTGLWTEVVFEGPDGLYDRIRYEDVKDLVDADPHA